MLSARDVVDDPTRRANEGALAHIVIGGRTDGSAISSGDAGDRMRCQKTRPIVRSGKAVPTPIGMDAGTAGSFSDGVVPPDTRQKTTASHLHAAANGWLSLVSGARDQEADLWRS